MGGFGFFILLICIFHTEGALQFSNTKSVSLERKAEHFSKIRSTERKKKEEALLLLSLYSSVEKASWDMRRETQRAGLHVSRIAIRTPTTFTDFNWHPKASAGGEESYPWPSGTQRREGTGEEIRNSSWRTEIEAHTFVKRRALKEDGVLPAEPAVQKSALKPGQGREGSSCPVSFSQKQGGQFACQIFLPKPKERWSAFKREEDFDSMLLPF